MTMPVLAALHVPTAAEFAQVTDAIDAAQGAWPTYTPSWWASAGTPSVGNGTLTGQYMKTGRTVHLSLTLIAGSTTTFGTAGAYWRFGLPTSHVAAAIASGVITALDPGGSEYGGVARIRDGWTYMELYRPVSGRWYNNNPWTMASGDDLNVSITYQTTA